MTGDEVAGRFPDEYADWVAGRDVSRRGGETRAEVAERACAALDDLPLADMTVIVTHSATAMALSAALLGLPQDPHVLGPLANCHWTELRSDTRWQLRAHNAGPQARSSHGWRRMRTFRTLRHDQGELRTQPFTGVSPGKVLGV